MQAERLSLATIKRIDAMTAPSPYATRPVNDEDMVVTWREDHTHMVVDEWGTGYLLMGTFSGYISNRLTDRQRRILFDYWMSNRYERG